MVWLRVWVAATCLPFFFCVAAGTRFVLFAFGLRRFIRLHVLAVGFNVTYYYNTCRCRIPFTFPHIYFTLLLFSGYPHSPTLQLLFPLHLTPTRTAPRTRYGWFAPFQVCGYPTFITAVNHLSIDVLHQHFAFTFTFCSGLLLLITVQRFCITGGFRCYRVCTTRTLRYGFWTCPHTRLVTLAAPLYCYTFTRIYLWVHVALYLWFRVWLYTHARLPHIYVLLLCSRVPLLYIGLRRTHLRFPFIVHVTHLYGYGLRVATTFVVPFMDTIHGFTFTHLYNLTLHALHAGLRLHVLRFAMPTLDTFTFMQVTFTPRGLPHVHTARLSARGCGSAFCRLRFGCVLYAFAVYVRVYVAAFTHLRLLHAARRRLRTHTFAVCLVARYCTVCVRLVYDVTFTFRGLRDTRLPRFAYTFTTLHSLQRWLVTTLPFCLLAFLPPTLYTVAFTRTGSYGLRLRCRLVVITPRCVYRIPHCIFYVTVTHCATVTCGLVVFIVVTVTVYVGRLRWLRSCSHTLPHHAVRSRFAATTAHPHPRHTPVVWFTLHLPRYRPDPGCRTERITPFPPRYTHVIHYTVHSPDFTHTGYDTFVFLFTVCVTVALG